MFWMVTGVLTMAGVPLLPRLPVLGGAPAEPAGEGTGESGDGAPVLLQGEKGISLLARQLLCPSQAAVNCYGHSYMVRDTRWAQPCPRHTFPSCTAFSSPRHAGKTAFTNRTPTPSAPALVWTPWHSTASFLSPLQSLSVHLPPFSWVPPPRGQRQILTTCAL